MIVWQSISRKGVIMAGTSKKSVSRKRTSTIADKRSTGKRPAHRIVVLVATRKGAWLFHGDERRRT
jgi:hypothetical protein